jgi:hypothetical protein
MFARAFASLRGKVLEHQLLRTAVMTGTLLTGIGTVTALSMYIVQPKDVVNLVRANKAFRKHVVSLPEPHNSVDKVLESAMMDYFVLKNTSSIVTSKPSTPLLRSIAKVTHLLNMTVVHVPATSPWNLLQFVEAAEKACFHKSDGFDWARAPAQRLRNVLRELDTAACRVAPGRVALVINNLPDASQLSPEERQVVISLLTRSWSFYTVLLSRPTPDLSLPADVYVPVCANEAREYAENRLLIRYGHYSHHWCEWRARMASTMIDNLGTDATMSLVASLGVFDGNTDTANSADMFESALAEAIAVVERTSYRQLELAMASTLDNSLRKAIELLAEEPHTCPRSKIPLVTLLNLQRNGIVRVVDDVVVPVTGCMTRAIVKMGSDLKTTS